MNGKICTNVSKAFAYFSTKKFTFVPFTRILHDGFSLNLVAVSFCIW